MPKYVRPAVAVKIRNLYRVPRRDTRGRIGTVIDEAAIPLGQPVADYSVIIAPQNVGTTVAVEIAHTDNIPRRADVQICNAAVIGEAAGWSTKPVGRATTVFLPEDVRAAVTVEVADRGDLPREIRASSGIAPIVGPITTGVAEVVVDDALRSP